MLSTDHARILLGCIARRCSACKRPATRVTHYRYTGSSPHTFNMLVCDDDACRKTDPRWVFLWVADLEEADAVRDLYALADIASVDSGDQNVWERTVSYGTRST